MDATPLTLGQEFSAFQAMMENNMNRLKAKLPLLREIAQGGTAVGTGINTYEGFDRAIAEELTRITGETITTAPNKFEALSSNGQLVELSGTLNTIAVSLMKVRLFFVLRGRGTLRICGAAAAALLDSLARMSVRIF